MENRILLMIALFLIMIVIVGGCISVRDDKKDISEKYIYNGTDNGTENNNDNDTESTANFVAIPCIVPGLVNIGSGVCITTDNAWQKK